MNSSAVLLTSSTSAGFRMYLSSSLRFPRTLPPFLVRHYRGGADRTISPFTAESEVAKPWKDSASLILAAPSSQDPKKDPLQFLIMKRSKGNMFLPNSLCFPGGQVSPVDFDMDWIDLYQILGGVDVRQSVFLSDSAMEPVLYGRRNRENDPRRVLGHMFRILPLQVSFRLAAIRETFEEVGVLLCKQVDKSSRVDRGFGRDSQPGLGKHANFLAIEDPSDLEKWQGRVRSEPKGLIQMCKHFGVLPDLNALVEWNNWLTPNSLKPKRFDTIFYMATVPFPLPFLIDDIEVASARWSNAKDVLNAAAAGKTRLIPPQIYELTRLQNTSLDKLRQLMKMRLAVGVERWCPCYFKVADGILSVLPGDELYPQNYKIDSFEDVRELPETIANLRKNTSSHHRIEFKTDYEFELVANITPKFGQAYSS